MCMKDSLSPYEIDNLIDYLKLRNFVELVATGRRPDGTYNLGREALQWRAENILKEIKKSKDEVMENMG
jgi:hypothetical protein